MTLFVNKVVYIFIYIMIYTQLKICYVEFDVTKFIFTKFFH